MSAYRGRDGYEEFKRYKSNEIKESPEDYGYGGTSSYESGNFEYPNNYYTSEDTSYVYSDQLYFGPGNLTYQDYYYQESNDTDYSDSYYDNYLIYDPKEDHFYYHPFASIESCVDEKSPAEDCFDYFTLSLFSPTAKALFARRFGKKYHKHKVIDDWGIHGLWPTAHEGGEELQDWCNKVYLRFKDMLLLGDEVLVERLHKLWFALYDDPDRSDESFWRYQFNKHGRCATRSNYIYSQQGYFEATLDLYNDIDLKKTLANGGFVEGTTIKLADLYRIVREKHGYYPNIKYEFDRVSQKNYLTEIQFCYNHNLKPIDHSLERHMNPKNNDIKISYLA